MFCGKWKDRVAELEEIVFKACTANRHLVFELTETVDKASEEIGNLLFALMAMAKVNQEMNKTEAFLLQERDNHLTQLDILTRENQRLRRELEVKNAA